MQKIGEKQAYFRMFYFALIEKSFYAFLIANLNKVWRFEKKMLAGFYVYLPKFIWQILPYFT